MQQSAKSANERPLVSTRTKLFVLCAIFAHILIILSREFPIFKWQGNLNQATNSYVLFLGLDQSYTVFAPPPEFNLHFFAVVTRQSGLMEIWQYPRMDDLSLVDKLFKERYRKFLNDNLAADLLSSHRPALARYIARQKQNPQDPPYIVSIFYVLRPILLPGARELAGTGANSSEEYHPVLPSRLPDAFQTSDALKEGVHCLITYFVRPEDLK